MGEESEVEDRNTDLFFDVADIVEFSPDRYNQGTWGEFTPTDAEHDGFVEQFGYSPRISADDNGSEDSNWIHADVGCGSALCVAGHAVALNGWFPTLSGTLVHWGSVAQQPGSSTGVGRDVQELARELLGITVEESRTLFDAENVWTGDDLRAFGKGERILTYYEPTVDVDE